MPQEPNPPLAVGKQLSQVDLMIAWLEHNRRLINGTGKGSLVFNFGGDTMVPELIQKFELVKAPHKQLPT